MVHIRAIHFDLYQIANSGQCFRMEEISRGKFRVFNYRNDVVIQQDGQDFFFMCSDEDFETIWRKYFDLDTDYIEFDSLIPESDLLLQKGKEFGSGIRILRQDFWETCVSFIISQNNNIPRIKKCIQALCDRNGGLFPSPLNLQIMRLDDLGLGYRDEYLYDLADKVVFERISERELQSISYIEAMNKLKEIKGVGDKVANCICLFGLHKMEACPIDVWMKRVIAEDYHVVAPNWIQSPIAGYYQQLAFYYKRGCEG